MLRILSHKVGLTARNLLFIALGSAIMAFAMINIHEPSRITEGGILGLSLFLKRVFGISQTISSPLLDMICFAFAISLLGKQFLKASMAATISYSFFLSLFDFLGPVMPSFYNQPWIAATVGGIMIGAGCCLVMSQGGAAGGDDALALAVSTKTGLPVAQVFIIADFVVLAMSLVYIPASRLAWSFLTTLVSSLIIGQIEVRAPQLFSPAPAASGAAGASGDELAYEASDW